MTNSIILANTLYSHCLSIAVNHTASLSLLKEPSIRMFSKLHQAVLHIIVSIAMEALTTA